VIHHRLAGTAEAMVMKFSVNVLITMYRRTKKGFFEIRILMGLKEHKIVNFLRLVRGSRCGSRRHAVARRGRPNFPFHVTAADTANRRAADEQTIEQ